MKRTEFTRNHSLVTGLREILESEVFKAAQEVLQAEGPLKKREQGNADRILGRVEGYDDYASKLAELAHYSNPQNLLNEQVVDLEEENQHAAG